MKKKLTLVVTCVVLVAAMVIGGTLAYFTDKDDATNVFTVGKVDITLEETFTENSKLVPGVNVQKEVKIKNETDSEEAFVWYVEYIPSDLDSNDGTTGTNNALHVNSLGSTWDNYRENKDYWTDGQTEALPLEKTWDHDPEKELKIAVGPQGFFEQVTIDGVKYNKYVVLYHGKLAADEETTVAMCKVYLDTSVDVDENGKYYHILSKGPKAGTKEMLPTLDAGNPKIIIEAYGIQANGLTDINKDGEVDVYDAYLLYQSQATAVAEAAKKAN